MSKTQPIMDLLDRVAENGAYAPGLWPPEALNGLLMAERRKGLDNKQRRRLAGFLRSLPIKVDTETADQAWTATSSWRNAIDSRCTTPLTSRTRAAP
jgi:hypothetical protein